MRYNTKTKKFTIELTGMEEYIKKIDNLGLQLKPIAFEALEKSQKHVTDKLIPIAAKHVRTGNMRDSLIINPPVEFDGNVASIPVGFNIAHGGLPSIFLAQGTKSHLMRIKGTPFQHPGQKQDRELRAILYGKKMKDEIRDIQIEVFNRRINEELK